jgi:hypothetical protein
MRRLSALLAVVLFLSMGCKKAPPRVETVEDENQQALSVLQVGHPRSAGQLLSGFYKIEENAWRWTMGKFSVALQPPPGAARDGATLQLRFSIPDAIIARRGPITLSAAVGSTQLDPEAFSKPGECLYTRPVPADALKYGPVKVSFALDRFLKAGEVEARELGIVVTSVGLLSK